MAKVCHACGAVLDKKRSVQQHRRLFAIIHAAFHQWPENHEFHPESSEHLRAWLLCKAGWRTSALVEHDAMASAETLAGALSAAIDPARPYPFIRVQQDRVAIHQAKSMEFAEADQRTFAPHAQAIDEIIEAVVGVPTDQLLKQRAA